MPTETTKRWDNKRLPPTMRVKDMEPALLAKLEARLCACVRVNHQRVVCASRQSTIAPFIAAKLCKFVVATQQLGNFAIQKKTTLLFNSDRLALKMPPIGVMTWLASPESLFAPCCRVSTRLTATRPPQALLPMDLQLYASAEEVQPRQLRITTC